MHQHRVAAGAQAGEVAGRAPGKDIAAGRRRRRPSARGRASGRASGRAARNQGARDGHGDRDAVRVAARRRRDRVVARLQLGREFEQQVEREGDGRVRLQHIHQREVARDHAAHVLVLVRGGRPALQRGALLRNV